MSEDSWIRTEIKEIILYIAIGLFMTVIAPLFGGFILRGFSESFASSDFNISTYLGAFIVYFFLILGSMFLIIFPIGRMVAVDRNDHPATQKNPSWFTIFTISLIHSPEENGALYRLFHWLNFKKNPMRWSLSIFRVFYISVLIFGVIGIAQLSYPQLNVAGVPQKVSQQISPTSDIIFGAFVPAFSENGILLLIFFFLLGIDAYVCSKFKLGLGAFFTLAIIFVIPLSALFWRGFHLLVYSTSDTKLLATLIFAFSGLLITLLLASMIPFLVWHVSNNLFIKLQEWITIKEDIYFIAIVVLVLFFVASLTGEIILSRFKRRKAERIVVPE